MIRIIIGFWTLIPMGSVIAQSEMENAAPAEAVGDLSSEDPSDAQQPGGKIDELQFDDIANDLRCPTCQGLSILGSSASFSEQIKKTVREQMEQGKSKQEILDFFVARYGPWILREPPKKGVNLFAWILPIAILAGGPLLIWMFVWRRQRVFDGGSVRPTEKIVAQMEKELSVLRKGSQA